MHLETHQSVHNVNAIFFYLARPADVALLVEAGFQLQQHGDLFTVLRGFQQGIDTGSISAYAIKVTLMARTLGSRAAFWSSVDNRLKRLERMLHQNVAPPNGCKDIFVFVLGQGGRHGRHKRSEFQVGAIQPCGSAPAPATAARRLYKCPRVPTPCWWPKCAVLRGHVFRDLYANRVGEPALPNPSSTTSSRSPASRS